MIFSIYDSKGMFTSVCSSDFKPDIINIVSGEYGSAHFYDLGNSCVKEKPECPSKFHKFCYVTKTWVESEELIEFATDDIRQQRNKLLKETDWTQGIDVPDTVKNIWAPYRQELRDMLGKEGVPHSVVWPIPPDAVK